ncbi:DUF1858 domain-containing protein [Aerococcaceae bacterium WGS1372]
MENVIDLTQSVYSLVEAHPDLLEILVDLGFTPLANETMRKTLGKNISLQQGCRFIKLNETDLINTLKWNGYIVKGAKSHD